MHVRILVVDMIMIAAVLTNALDLPRVGPYLYVFDLYVLTSLQSFQTLIDNMVVVMPNRKRRIESF